MNYFFFLSIRINNININIINFIIKNDINYNNSKKK